MDLNRIFHYQKTKYANKELSQVVQFVAMMDKRRSCLFVDIRWKNIDQYTVSVRKRRVLVKLKLYNMIHRFFSRAAVHSYDTGCSASGRLLCFLSVFSLKDESVCADSNRLVCADQLPGGTGSDLVKLKPNERSKIKQI